MRQRISFKQYLETKDRLKLAGQNCPRSKQVYEVVKYCKLPLLDDINESDAKQYISLKPKDTIEILWEYESPEHRIPKQITLTFDNDQVMYFAWSNAKVSKWVESFVIAL